MGCGRPGPRGSAPGRAVASALGGIDSADAAIEADKAAEWRQLRRRPRDYATVRADHLALLQAEDVRTFHNRAPVLGYAYFGGIEDVFPAYLQAARRDSCDLMGRPTPVHFPVRDVAFFAHFLAVVRDRDRLRPHVGQPDEAIEAMGRTSTFLAEAERRSVEPGQLAQRYGGEADLTRSYFGPPAGQVVFGPRPDL